MFQLAIHHNQGCTGAVCNMIDYILKAVGVCVFQSDDDDDDDGRQGRENNFPEAGDSDVCTNCGKAGSRACCTSSSLERSC